MSNWFCPSFLIPDKARVELSEWAQSVEWPEGTVLKRPSRYHVTVMYSATGGSHPRKDAFLAAIQPPASFRVWTARVEQLTPGNALHNRPIGVVLSNDLLRKWVESDVLYQGGMLDFQPNTFGSYKPHVTVAEIPPGDFDVFDIEPPDVTWETPWEIVDLREHYRSLRDA